MATITIDKAERELGALIKRARAGEEIVISDGVEPSVKLMLMPSKTSYRGRGALKGRIAVTDKDLFDPLPDEELGRWWGAGDEK